MCKSRLLTAFFIAGISCTSAQADYVYQIADHTAEEGVLESNADIFLLNQYTAYPGADTITSISIAVGWTGWNANLSGRPITVAVWSDPNQDGDPSDAVLLQSLSTTVNAVNNIANGESAYGAYTVPATHVTGKFFVGYMLSVPSTETISVARTDTTTAQHRSWLAEAPFGQAITYISDLDNPSMITAVMNYDDLAPYGFTPGNLQIEATGVPEPSTLALLALGCLGFVACAWPRRRVR
jgi:hypothetical protein